MTEFNPNHAYVFNRGISQDDNGTVVAGFSRRARRSRFNLTTLNSRRFHHD